MQINCHQCFWPVERIENRLKANPNELGGLLKEDLLHSGCDVTAQGVYIHTRPHAPFFPIKLQVERDFVLFKNL